MADILGIISGTLGIISFLTTLSSPGSNDQTSVELAVGYAKNPTTGEQLDSPDGNFGHVYLFSPINTRIGDKSIGGNHIDKGTTYQLKVDTTGEQPEYMEVTATNDAVCMSWMAVTYGSAVADGTFAFFGDFFEYCGLSSLEWYYGGLRAGTRKDTNDPHYPRCGWLDKDHTNGHQYASLKARMTVFRTLDNSDPKSFYCRPPTLEFGTDTNIIDKREHARDIKNTGMRKRSGTRGDNSLVVSSIPSHSAKELCASPTSSGPDFVSLTEGLYCDMTSQEIKPLCSLDNLVERCFDLDVAQNTTSDVLDSVIYDKVFSRIVEWAES